jgi:hypothetical protein
MTDLGGLDISFSAIFSSLLFSAIGWWLFQKGRKENEIKIVLNGLALMLYSYFTHGPILDWGIGAVLCGLAYHLTH